MFRDLLKLLLVSLIVCAVGLEQGSCTRILLLVDAGNKNRSQNENSSPEYAASVADSIHCSG